MAASEDFWDDILGHLKQRVLLPVIGPEMVTVPDGDRRPPPAQNRPSRGLRPGVHLSALPYGILSCMSRPHGAEGAMLTEAALQKLTALIEQQASPDREELQAALADLHKAIAAQALLIRFRSQTRRPRRKSWRTQWPGPTPLPRS